jgi:hypothetical protein
MTSFVPSDPPEPTAHRNQLYLILIASSKESWNRKNSPMGAYLNAPVTWGRRITDLASVIILSRLLRTAFALALHERAWHDAVLSEERNTIVWSLQEVPYCCAEGSLRCHIRPTHSSLGHSWCR